MEGLPADPVKRINLCNKADGEEVSNKFEGARSRDERIKVERFRVRDGFDRRRDEKNW